jgi:hypothetical protein
LRLRRAPEYGAFSYLSPLTRKSTGNRGDDDSSRREEIPERLFYPCPTNKFADPINRKPTASVIVLTMAGLVGLFIQNPLKLSGGKVRIVVSQIGK